MIKRFLSLLLIALLVIGLMPISSFAEEIAMTGEEVGAIEPEALLVEPAEEGETASEEAGSVEGETSVEEEAPIEEEAPVEEEVPAEEEAPTEEDALAEEEAPVDTEEQLVDLEMDDQAESTEADLQSIGLQQEGPVSMKIGEGAEVVYLSLELAFQALQENGAATAVITITDDTESTTARSFNGYHITIQGNRQKVALAPLRIYNGDLTVKNLDVSMSPNGANYTLHIGQAASNNTDVTFDNVNLKIDGKGTVTASAITLQIADGKTATLNIINGSKVEVVGYKGGNYVGNAIFTESEGEKVINVEDSSFTSDGNRSGLAVGVETYINIKKSTFDVLNSFGNGSNGGYWDIKDNSEVTFKNNVDNGLSTVTLNVEDSSISSTLNGANGIIVNPGSREVGLSSTNSTIFVNKNELKLISQWTKPGGIWLRGQKNTITGGSVTITENSGPGLHLDVRAGSSTPPTPGSLVIDDSVALEIKYNRAYGEGLEGLYARGAGVYVIAGEMVLPSKAVIYNNRARIEADDIFVNEGGKLTLYPVGSDWILNEDPEWDENHLIDGWYDDSASDRWSAHIDPTIYVKEDKNLGVVKYGPLTLKAAHTAFIEIEVNKIWDGGPDLKPDITIRLFADGEPAVDRFGDEIAPVVLTDGKVTHTFTDLPKFAVDELIKYSVAEVELDDYDTEIDEFEITNTYKIPLGDVTAKKVWVNGPEVKPDIVLQLMRDGKAFGEPITLKHPETSYTWKDLELETKDAVAYKFEVVEIGVPANYAKKEEGLTVTNEYVIPLGDVTAKKVWVNGPEVKPDIVLQLMRDGKAFGEPITLKHPETSYTWKDLELETKDAVAYKFEVVEIGVPANYAKKEEGLTVTNEYVIPKTEITAKKVWNGGPAMKPDVTLQLIRDGKAFGEPIVLKHPATSYVWKELDATDLKGKAYVYTVDEVNAPTGYEKSVEGFVVTNSFLIEKIDVTATKKWVGGPKEKPVIHLQLYRDGKPVGDAVQLKDATVFTWKDLDKTDAEGKVYVYTIKETSVPKDYKATYSKDGLTVTNTWTKEVLPGTGSTTGTWMLILGAILLLGGSALIFYTKRRNANS
jgi:LPXTG-motif cell wall-anchored protein